jgi:hypothetical protein
MNCPSIASSWVQLITTVVHKDSWNSKVVLIRSCQAIASRKEQRYLFTTRATVYHLNYELR